MTPSVLPMFACSQSIELPSPTKLWDHLPNNEENPV